MNIKGLNIFRGRLINFRLFGNLRWGIYKEISVAEIVEFIAEFRDYCAARDGQGTAEQQTPALPPLDNFRILQRLCEQYYVYEGTERFQQKIKLFCYLQAGFTPTMISVLLNKDKSVVYNRVSRLKAKIGQA